VSKPGPSIADPSNTALAATASHRTAAAAEAERRIRAEIAAQRAAEGSPVITPPETPNSNQQRLTPNSPIEDDDNTLEDLGDNLNLVEKKRSTKSKQAHVPVNSRSYN
jgi:hypothetical protein